MKKWPLMIMLVALSCGCDRKGSISVSNPDANAEREESISVTLNGAPASVVGVDWPTGKTKTVERPHTITLTFPSGRVFRSYSKLTILDQKNERVTGVMITPMRDVNSFSSALTMVKQVVSELKVADKPIVRERIQKWEKSIPAFSASTGAIIEHRVLLFIRMEPHAERNGWFVSLEFSYLSEDLWDHYKDD